MDPLEPPTLAEAAGVTLLSLVVMAAGLVLVAVA